MNDLLECYWELEARLAEDTRRRRNDRILTLVTAISEPVPDEPADSFELTVKATRRLREAMTVYQERYGWGFEDTPKNLYPRYGAQLTIEEDAIFNVIGRHWDELYDGKSEQIVDLLRDFVYGLTKYYPLVQFARGRWM